MSLAPLSKPCAKCHRYYLPEHIRVHVDFITPGISFSGPLKKKEIKRDIAARHFKPGPWKMPPPHWPWTMPPGAGQLPADLQNCGHNVTPPCLKALYNIPDAHRKDDVNQLGLYEQGDTYNQQDLNAFFKTFAPQIPQGTHPLLDGIDGGTAPVASPADGGPESEIDMDISYSLIYVSFDMIKPSSFSLT